MTLRAAALLLAVIGAAAGCSANQEPPAKLDVASAAAPSVVGPEQQPAGPPSSPANLADPVSGPMTAPAAPLKLGPPGAASSQISGCLAQGSGSEDDGARFPPAIATRGGASAPPVGVTTSGNGIIVTHDLAHACCLQGDVSTKIDGTSIEVTETLSGQACRCQCRSSLKTAIGLAPGGYGLKVRLIDPSGNAREIHAASIEIKTLRPR